MIKNKFKIFKSRTWANLQSRTVNGLRPNWKFKKISNYLKKGIELRLTREDFRNWCDENEAVFWDILHSGETPSIDRIDSMGHYEVGNIRIISNRENSGISLRKISESRMKPVIGTHKKTGEKITLRCLAESKKLGIAMQNVSACALGKQKTAGGYVWRFI